MLGGPFLKEYTLSRCYCECCSAAWPGQNGRVAQRQDACPFAYQLNSIPHRILTTECEAAGACGTRPQVVGPPCVLDESTVLRIPSQWQPCLQQLPASQIGRAHV